MKRLALFLALVLALTGCARVAPVPVRWVEEGSCFLDFAVEGREVHLRYLLVLTNDTDIPQRVRVTLFLPEDVEGGLLTEGTLSTELEIRPGTAGYGLTFTGPFGGTAQKQDRLLPEKIEVVPADI